MSSDTDTSSPAAASSAQDKEMPFFEHLAELRKRIIFSLGAWAVGSLATWQFTPNIIAFLRKLIGNTELVFLRPTEAFFVYFKVAMVGGFFLASPVILYQAAAFIMPGMEANERKWFRRVIPGAILLFVGGSAFAYYALLPITLKFFLGFQTQDLKAMISLSEYINFVVFLTVVCGLVFQTPIVMILLAAFGIVSSAMLRRGRKWAILIIFIIAALVTPTPDAFTQTMVAIPMILLYEISIWIIKALGK